MRRQLLALALLALPAHQMVGLIAQVRAGFSGYDAFVPKADDPRALGECVDSLIRRRRR